MSLDTLFQAAVRELRRRKALFAVAGGFAAGLYRREPRLTMDVDLGILTASNGTEIARAILQALGLKPGIARQADLAGGPLFAIRRKNTVPCIIVGRPDGAPAAAGVDLLLPSIPWVRDAVLRAQDHEVDFGFGQVPVLTLEDVILSKLYALMAAHLRAKDLDDLQSIYEANHEMDMPYLAGQMQRLKIVIPRAAKPFLPKTLITLARQGGRS